MAKYGTFKYSQAPYGLRSRVFKTLTLVYDIQAYIIKQLSLVYNVFNPVVAVEIADSYSESNRDGYSSVNKVGQSFTGNGKKLNNVIFYLSNLGLSKTGNVVSKIYAHSGTFGTSSLPTGSPLAVSAQYDVYGLTSNYQLITFNYNGDNKIILQDGTYYVVTIENAGDLSGAIGCGVDSSSPTHNGNLSQNIGYEWKVSTRDAIFYVNTEKPHSLTIKYNLFNPVSKTLTLIYNLWAQVSKTLTLKYNLFRNIVQTLTLLYNIAGSVIKDFTLKYDLYGTTFKNLTLKYNVFDHIYQTLTLKYKLFNPITKTLTLIYKLWVYILKTLTIKYHLRNMLGLWFLPISKPSTNYNSINKPTTNYSNVSKPSTIWKDIEDIER